MKIICISGKAGSGKDFTAQIMKQNLEKSGLTVKIIHFADLLKSVCRDWFDWDGEERLEYILDIVENLGFSRKDYKNYLKILIQLDLLIENCDRHVHNCGLIFKNGNFWLPPIFDNGLSLRTNHDEHPVSCTLSGSFMEQ